MHARSARAGTDRDVAAAARCYAAGDLTCVVDRLQNSPSKQPERWRMLAFAAARLDRHQLARSAFAGWIALDAAHRLQRDVTPPAIWRDYAAALIAVHGDQLDLKPRLEPPAVLPAAAATGTTLPRFAPPPRSKRDQNTDFALWFGGLVGRAWDTGEAAGGVELTLAMNLSPRWRVGVQATALRHPAEPSAAVDDLGPPGVFAGAGVRLDALLLAGGLGELGLGGTAGFGVLDWDDGRSESMAAFRPALRYAWPARERGGQLGVWLEISHGFLVGGARARQLDLGGRGIELRPGRDKRPAKRSN